jgi:hypothetical protein
MRPFADGVRLSIDSSGIQSCFSTSDVTQCLPARIVPDQLDVSSLQIPVWNLRLNKTPNTL